ncbi:MAG: hypothetical protein RL684_3307 [Pseudomonadota bacterium]|jgi:hypothetical protein
MKADPVPPDQFARCKEELAKLTRLVEEVDRALDTAEGIPKFEAQRALALCRNEIETAAMWLAKAIREVQAK